MCTSRHTITAGDDWTVIGHAYLPLPFFGGTVSKYQGLVTRRNREHLVSLGCSIHECYHGDRIMTADPLTEYTGG